MIRFRMGVCVAALLPVLFAGCAFFGNPEPFVTTEGENPTLIPEVPFFPTPPEVVDAMLELGGVGSTDVVYDLGCGDGRIVIAAAAKYGAHGVGVDIDPAPLLHARRNAERLGVADRVRFVRGDIFASDLRPATVVMLYLFTEVNRKLLPKLLAELPAGARIVSHKFDMGDAWTPEKAVRAGDSMIYLWTVPRDKRIR